MSSLHNVPYVAYMIQVIDNTIHCNTLRLRQNGNRSDYGHPAGGENSHQVMQDRVQSRVGRASPGGGGATGRASGSHTIVYLPSLHTKPLGFRGGVVLAGGLFGLIFDSGK